MSSATREEILYRNAESNQLRMDAYYYAFVDTGIEAIDKILAAVAVAGKRAHHTEFWIEEEDDLDGLSMADLIQEMADKAAEEWRRNVKKA